jgi:hypothetical protein
LAVPDTKSETVKKELKAGNGFWAKFLVVTNTIIRFIAYMEIGTWFWFLVFFLLALAYVLVFGPLRPVHEW